MFQSFESAQKAGKEQFDLAVKNIEATQKGVQAIATEVADYSKKAFEQNAAALEQITAVKSVEKAIELQTNFGKTAFEGFVAHSTKISEMTSEVLKNAFKPLEAAFAQAKAK